MKKNTRDHLTKKQKGAIAVSQTIADLAKKGWEVFVPINDILRYDIIASKEEDLYRIQVKYSSDGTIANGTSYHSSAGNNKVFYQEGDFDYYAIYLPDIDQVIYPPLELKGKKVRTTLPDSPKEFYWWEDFVNFSNSHKKRKLKEWNIQPSTHKHINYPTKIEWPNKEELQKLLWEMPSSSLAKELGVSDKAIEKRAKKFGLTKPPRGYWTKLKSGKLT